MYYIIYKTTNLINGKFYIGKHQTKDLNDGYMGSGRLINRAIKKYGLDQFKTEIIEMCPTEAHMNLAEKIYVVIDPEVSYNLCRGGKGGFGYINDNKLNGGIVSDKSRSNLLEGDGRRFQRWKLDNPEEYIQKCEKITATNWIKYPNGTFGGRKHSEKTKLIMAEKARLRKSNSQTGTMWITNGCSNAKIKIKDSVPDGWYRGRTM